MYLEEFSIIKYRVELHHTPTVPQQGHKRAVVALDSRVCAGLWNILNITKYT